MEWSHIRFTHDYWVILMPLVFIGIDLLTGYLNAWRTHNIKSCKMRDGIAKKAGEIIMILGIQVMTLALAFPKWITVFFSIYVTFTEINSNLENLSKLGVRVPVWISSRVNQVLEDADNKKIEG